MRAYARCVARYFTRSRAISYDTLPPTHLLTEHHRVAEGDVDVGQYAWTREVASWVHSHRAVDWAQT